MYFLPLGNTTSPRSFVTPCAVLPPTIVNNFSTKTSLRESNSPSYFTSSPAISSLSFALVRLSLTARANNFLLITTPCNDGEAFKEASFTSPALSPKIARNNFSSGVGSLSPFGVILPMRISPGFTSAPILIIPFSSKSFVASSETLGISFVSSSFPSLVSLTSREYSSI